MEYVLILIVLAVMLVLCIIGLSYEIGQSRKAAIDRIAEAEHKITLIRAEIQKWREHERLLSPRDVLEMKHKMIKLESRMNHLDLSMNRFAPPLDEDREYKSITISGKIK